MGPKDIGVTTLPFLGHVTSSVICHVTNRFAICHYLLVSYLNRAFTAPVYEIFGPASTHIHTHTRAPQVILYSVPYNVLHWIKLTLWATISALELAHLLDSTAILLTETY